MFDNFVVSTKFIISYEGSDVLIGSLLFEMSAIRWCEYNLN